MERARFPARVLKAVLEEVGSSVAVTCKIGVTEGFKGGGTAEDAVQIAQTLQRAGAHLLVLSGGMNVEAPWAIFGSNMPPAATDVIDNKIIRTATRLMKLWEPKSELPRAVSARALAEDPRRREDAAGLSRWCQISGRCAADMADGFDSVVMGRALLHEPNLVQQFRDGTATVSGCTACNQCVVKMYTAGGTQCVLHPPNDVLLNQTPAA